MVEFQLHYLPKKISDIDSNDTRIRITGIVIEITDNNILIDDGSGSIRVSVNSPELLENISINSLIRIYGLVVPAENGFEIRANIIQDLSDLDINLFKKTQEVYKKWGCELNV
jgi:molybdate-binding protein